MDLVVLHMAMVVGPILLAAAGFAWGTVMGVLLMAKIALWVMIAAAVNADLDIFRTRMFASLNCARYEQYCSSNSDCCSGDCN